jgi:hypothetical protein
MSIFSKIFGKGNSEMDPFPTRPLKLSFEISPENGEKFAKQFADTFKLAEGIQLDYSPDSIKLIDNFLQSQKDEGLKVNEIAERIFLTGCYVGQVIVNNINSSKWINVEDANLPEGISMSAILINIGTTVWDPISKAYKRFYNGRVDNLDSLYAVISNESIK